MKIGIIGLGLIGGSIAKAYKKYSDAKVFGFDIDKKSLSYAKLSETVDGTLTDEILSECDIVFILSNYNNEDKLKELFDNSD